VLQAVNVGLTPAFVIGRDPSVSDFKVENTTVSRQHCALLHKEDQTLVVDLSSIGTTLNGVKLEREKYYRVHPDSIIAFGKCKRVFSVVERIDGQATLPRPRVDAPT
jgi:pSer/pThr/pTyr-binding forkhead associated (FHA) protein